MPIDPTLLILAGARALPLAFLLPLGGRDVPRALSLALLLALASILSAFSPALTTPLLGDAWVVSIGCELAIGAAFALACAAPFIALHWAGQLSHTVMLLRAPGAEAAPLAMLFRLAGLNLFFLLGGHRALSAALVSSLDDVPLGLARLRTEPLALGVAQLAVDALALSLSLALPLLLTLWLLDVALGLMARASGARNLSIHASPLRFVLALAVLALTFTPMIDAFPLAVREGMATARSLLRAIAG